MKKNIIKNIIIIYLLFVQYLKNIIKKIYCFLKNNNGSNKQITTLTNQITDYYITRNDDVVQIDNYADINVYLQKASLESGKTVIITKISDNKFKIVIKPYGGDTINGDQNLTITLDDIYERISLLSNGKNINYIV